MQFREAGISDGDSLAKIRSEVWGNEAYWKERITGYMNCTHHPQQALMPRIIYVAIDDESIVGFIAGHLTRRYDCDGELEWVNVISNYRMGGVAFRLLKLLAAWFIQRNAHRICVDADPGNVIARNFYTKYGAVELNKHWLVWNDIRVVLAE